jgi:hypothetical protein
MSNAGRSLFIFGIYLAVLGFAMLIIPNLLLGIFGLPSTSEVWIRVAGVLVLVIAFYDIQAGRNSLTSFLKWSVIARTSIIFFFAALVLFGLVKPVLILFGALDLAGAVWTFFALRTSK